MAPWNIRLLETSEEMSAVEALQREVWPGSETDVVPAHLLITVVHNGGVVLGAFVRGSWWALSLAFRAWSSHQTGRAPSIVRTWPASIPDHRDSGIGFALKRAQWQMVRHQSLDHITWTYDPLLSRNAHLNIARLGAVCSTYRRSEYGDMRDGLNAGLPSDRFQVDWWINTKRVERRLGKHPRPTLEIEPPHTRGRPAVVYASNRNRKPGPSSRTCACARRTTGCRRNPVGFYGVEGR